MSGTGIYPCPLDSLVSYPSLPYFSWSGAMCPRYCSKRLFNFCMRTITKRWFFCPLATAEKYLFGFIRRKFNRRKRSALMRAVAEWLFLAQAARTPIISFPLFNIYCIRHFLYHFRFFHMIFSFLFGRITYSQLLFIWFPDKFYLLLSGKLNRNVPDILDVNIVVLYLKSRIEFWNVSI